MVEFIKRTSALNNKLLTRSGKRNSGLQEALDAYIKDMTSYHPYITEKCDEVAKKLLSDCPIDSKNLEFFTVISSHCSENLEKTIDTVANQNVNKKKFELILFINGKDQNEVDKTSAKAAKYIKNKYPSLKARIITATLDKWLFSAKHIPNLVALQMLKKSKIDHDIALDSLDADFISVKGLETKHEAINEGALIASTDLPRESPDKIIEKNDINLSLAFLLNDLSLNYSIISPSEAKDFNLKIKTHPFYTPQNGSYSAMGYALARASSFNYASEALISFNYAALAATLGKEIADIAKAVPESGALFDGDTSIKAFNVNKPQSKRYMHDIPYLNGQRFHNLGSSPI